MDLTGKTAWVVGGSSGIGAAVAQELVRRGARVAVSARGFDRLVDVAGDRMLVVPVDVTDAAAVATAAARVRAELGPLDLVVLSAGYWRQMDPAEWDTEEVDRHVRVNISGVSNALGAILPDMLARGSGVIAGIASVAGFRGMPGAEAYGATKAAQINLLESLRVHVAGSGVRVTTICPGFVRTPMTADNRFAMPFMVSPEQAARSICDGLERDRVEIVFPAPMAVLMKTARYVPVRLWPHLWTGSRMRVRHRACEWDAMTQRQVGGAAGESLPRGGIRLTRTVVVERPLEFVFAYLADFRTTAEWDPATVSTERLSGEGGVGTAYRNTSTFLGRRSRLEYVVEEHVTGRLVRLRGENASIYARDIMHFARTAEGTEVTYVAEFEFRGLARLAAPLLRPALTRLVDRGAAGMRRALNELPARSPEPALPVL